MELLHRVRVAQVQVVEDEDLQVVVRAETVRVLHHQVPVHHQAVVAQVLVQVQVVRVVEDDDEVEDDHEETHVLRETNQEIDMTKPVKLHHQQHLK